MPGGNKRAYVLKNILVVTGILLLKHAHISVKCRHSERKAFLHYALTLHEGGPYLKETSPLICRANQRTGFYVIRSSVMK